MCLIEATVVIAHTFVSPCKAALCVGHVMHSFLSAHTYTCTTLCKVSIDVKLHLVICLPIKVCMFLYWCVCVVVSVCFVPLCATAGQGKIQVELSTRVFSFSNKPDKADYWDGIEFLQDQRHDQTKTTSLL